MRDDERTHARERRGREERQEVRGGRDARERRGFEGWRRGRLSGGFGSVFDAWRSGSGIAAAGFGFGSAERPGPGGWTDEDWQPTRPARGRGAWAGDWEYASGQGQRRYGPIRGRGPKNYTRPDDRIYEDVCDRLTEDAAVDASDITVRVERGEVSLSGTVPTRDQKWRAEECAEQVAGVREVVNLLRTAGR